MYGVQQTLFASEHQPPADYLVGIYPNGEIAGEVFSFRDLLAQKIGVYQGQKDTPYMMLMAFSLPIEAEPELLRKLDECCFKQLRSTNVEITGFELIEENRSVLITPRQHQFLSTVVRKVSTVVRSAGKAKLRTIKSPGAIPIAAELNPEKYNQAFALFENKVYARICFANNLVLLRVKAPGQTPQLVKSFSIL